MPDARTHMPLRLQLACARHELAAMSAIVRTLAGLAQAEAGEWERQVEVFDARTGREAEP